MQQAGAVNGPLDVLRSTQSIFKRSGEAAEFSKSGSGEQQVFDVLNRSLAGGQHLETMPASLQHEAPWIDCSRYERVTKS